MSLRSSPSGGRFAGTSPKRCVPLKKSIPSNKYTHVFGPQVRSWRPNQVSPSSLKKCAVDPSLPIPCPPSFWCISSWLPRRPQGGGEKERGGEVPFVILPVVLPRPPLQSPPPANPPLMAAAPIGLLLALSGYEVTFADVDHHMVGLLQKLQPRGAGWSTPLDCRPGEGVAGQWIPTLPRDGSGGCRI